MTEKERLQKMFENPMHYTAAELKKAEDRLEAIEAEEAKAKLPPGKSFASALAGLMQDRGFDVHMLGPVKHIVIDPGDFVICDGCNEDWSESKESGGILFDSRAICPTCAPKWEKDAKEYGEEDHIRARCPEGMSFADWVRDHLR